MLPAYIVKKIAALLPVLLGISVLSFSLGVIAPGDPAEQAVLAGGVSNPSPEEIEDKRTELGLHRPIHIQYLLWLKRAVQGDLGRSYMTKTPVTSEILRRLPVTLQVSLLALSFTCAAGISMGLLMAVRQGGILDKLGRTLSVLFISLPGFWLALFLIYIFSERLRLLPTSGYGTFRQMIMPAAVLACVTTGVTIRLTRTTLLQEMRRQYMVTAHAKGLSAGAAALKHAFPNAVLPVITLLGTYFGNILGGSAVIETIFALPGMGNFALDAIYRRDYPSIQGYVLFTGFIFVMVNLLIDLAYAALNPQIRLGGGAK